MNNALEEYIHGGQPFAYEQFKCPPAVLHPTYSWLWSGKITREGISKQLDEMQSAGINSVYILPLADDFSPGLMATTLFPEYLSDEFFELVRFTAQYAQKKGMSMWLYDEGGFPSGMAGTKVVNAVPDKIAKKLVKTENGYELAPRYYPYMLKPDTPRYADSASEEANDVFIKLTYERYKKKTDGLFGAFLPIIFTDEPAIRYPALPDGARELYKERYGAEISEAFLK